MHPKNRMERAIGLRAIADKAEELEKSGANKIDVSNFIIGARNKLNEERPDLDRRAKATAVATKWANTNME
jgi:hypothetical protein